MFPKIMSSAKTTKFPPPSEGSHVAILTTIVDLGLQESRFGTKPKPELYLAFEITDEFNEWTDATGLRCEPKRVSTTVTNSMSEKAKLRAYVEGILGSRLSEAEQRACNVVDLVLGKACLLHVQHNESNGNVYGNIASLAPLPKSIPTPAMRTDLMVYTHTAHDQAVWDTLPKFLQERIAKRVVEEVTAPAPQTADAMPFNDDIPF